MRTIPKRTHPPAAYTAWLDTPLDDPAAKPTWDGMPSNVKLALDKALVTEQGRICCYCGARIAAIQGDHHIEHIVPGRTPDDAGALDYQNLMASCGPTKAKKPRRMQHCGEHKGDQALSVTPLQDDCAAYFRFTLDGRILPTQRDPECAADAIAVLNLGEPLLTRQRQSALRALDILSAGELQDLRRQCNQPRDGTLREFAFVIASAIDARLAGRP